MNKPYPLYETQRITNLRQLIDFWASKTPDAAAFRYAATRDSIENITFAALKNQTEALGTAFYDRGLKNCHVAILGENSYNWLLSFFSLTGGNTVVVPINKDLPVDLIKTFIRDSDCSALVYSETYADVAEEVQKSMDIQCVSMDEIKGMLEKGRALISAGNDEYIHHAVDEDRTVAIYYTSGTTGVSKGVMLSHKNFALNTYLSCQNIKVEGDSVLLLPLTHTFGLVAGVFIVLHQGHAVYINSSLRYMMSDLAAAKPQFLFVVPLLLDTLYKSIWNTAERNGKAEELRRLIEDSNAQLANGIDNRRKIFRSVWAAFGGNLDTIVSGSAPASQKCIEGFRDFGIKVLEGYGITECSPVISVNRNEFYKDGSVGQILSECRVRIDCPDSDGNGEICVSGPNVMRGYYHMSAETDKVMSGEWFHTGDIGYIDSDNFLFITGRKKNLIVLSSGEKVAPEELEALLQNIPLVCETVVFDDHGKIVAEIYLDIQYAEKHGITDIGKELNACVARLNRDLPGFKQINAVRLRDTEFEKTPTKKIKRNMGGC